MTKRLQNKIAVITGSTRGIGKEIAEAFAREGATAIIIGRDNQTVQQVAESLTKKGLQADGYACNITNLSEVHEIANKILDKHKCIDILVNNAGITKDNLLLRMSEGDWDDVMLVNLRGVFNCTKVISKAMLKEKKGKIINIASVIGISGNTGQANYAASKAGMIGFTKSVAKEFASRGITINAVAPGYITTDMTAALNEKNRDEILKGIPLGYFGEAKDIAATCLFLASNAADYITGQTLIVDGGMTM